MAISKILGSGIGAVNAPVEFTSADNLTQLTLSSTDADANVGPRLDLTRSTASPANNDYLGQIRLMGEDSGGNSLSYVSMFGQIIDTTDGGEDGSFELDVRLAGSNRSRMISNATETIFNDDSVDLDFRVEGNGDANLLFVDAGNDRVGIGTNAPVALTDSASPSLTIKSNGPYIFLLDANNANESIYLGNNSGRFRAGGANDDGGTQIEAFAFSTTEVTINEDSNDIDFRVESNASTHAFNVDGGDNIVWMFKTSSNTDSTGAEFRSGGNSYFTQAAVTNTPTAQIKQIGEGGNDDSDQGLLIVVDGTNTASGAGNVLRCEGTNSTHGAYADLLTVKNNATVFMNTTLTFGGVLNLYHGGVGIGEGSSSGEYRRMYWNTSNDDLRFWNGSNEGIINSSGAFVDASDINLKKDISDITYGIDTVKALKPRKYKMKLDSKEQVGFIAQEMETQIPEVVTAGTNPDGDEHKGIAYGQLTAVLTKALQEAITKIETLETKVAALEGS